MSPAAVGYLVPEASEQQHLALMSRLADGPVGTHPLLEAAFAWREWRPSTWQDLRPPGRQRHMPVAQVSRVEAAALIARQLSTLAWAIVTPTGNETPLFNVEVPASEYGRTIRGLTLGWRDCRRRLGEEQTAADNMQLAVGVWRTAIVAAATEATAHTIRVRVGNSVIAQMLGIAGTTLGQRPSVHRLRGELHVAMSGRHRVRRLLEEATAGRFAQSP